VNPIIQTPVANPTAWTVQPSGIEPVPNGSYFAEFVSVEPFSNAEKGIENKVRFSWKVLGGPQAGRNILPCAMSGSRLQPMQDGSSRAWPDGHCKLAKTY